ncbi:hypothetical protein D3C80_947630 [compost metagenome]
MAQALDIPLLTIVSPGGDKIIANPLNHPRYQAVDIFDVKGASYQLPRKYEKDFFDEELFRNISPESVIERLMTLPIGEVLRIKHHNV